MVVLAFSASARGAPDDRTEGWLLAVQSDSACPDAATVDRRTRELLGLAGDVTLKESVELAHEGSGLAVRLRAEDQRMLGERVLPLDDDCDALSRAVSVVLASWLTDAHPEFLAAREAPKPPEPPSPPQQPVPPPPRRTPHVAARGELRVDARLRYRPAAGLGALADAHGVVPAGMLGLVAAPAGSGLGITARAVVSLERTQPLGSGELVLLRFPLALGGVARLESGRVAAELHAGAAVAWLHLRGRGFVVEKTANDAAFGVFGALRGTVALGPVEPFLELSAFGWPGAGSASVEPQDPGVRLPRGELLPLAGAVLEL